VFRECGTGKLATGKDSKMGRGEEIRYKGSSFPGLKKF
jgi:hypothetical protein